MSQIQLQETSSAVLDDLVVDGNSGSASPSGDVLNVIGSGSLTTAATGNTLTAQLTGLTNHAVLVGAGTSTITKLPVGSDGQVMIGATGSDPGFGTITSGSIVFTAGPKSLNMEVSAAAAVEGKGFYGDGSDGTQTFDGSSVVLGLTPSSSIYTLARDIFLSSSTINNGVSIITNGFRIFCQGTLTNNGTIQWDGNAGTNTGVAGAALTNANASINTATGTTSPGTVGGVGNTGAGSNAGANASTNSFGGNGGNGASGVSSGGSGATITAPAAGFSAPRFLSSWFLGQTINGAGAIVRLSGGAGGGGGGGDAVNKGGGGGGGAGTVIVWALLFAGTGSIHATGGSGGAGQTGATNAGGGGGGGGGVVLILSRSVTSGVIAGQTITAGGGAGGVGTGLGATGSNGNAGTVILLQN